MFNNHTASMPYNTVSGKREWQIWAHNKHLENSNLLHGKILSCFMQLHSDMPINQLCYVKRSLLFKNTYHIQCKVVCYILLSEKHNLIFILSTGVLYITTCYKLNYSCLLPVWKWYMPNKCSLSYRHRFPTRSLMSQQLFSRCFY